MTSPWTPIRKIDEELESHRRGLFRMKRAEKEGWTEAVDDMAEQLKGDVALEDAQRAVAVGDGTMVTDRMAWQDVELNLLQAAEPLLAATAARAAVSELGRLKLNVSFDIRNPLVYNWIEEHAAKLVRQVSDETKKAVKAAIQQAFEEGLPPRRSAILIRKLVGLTERDAKAVVKYWQTVASDGNRPAKVADAMAETYAKRLLNRRAETIARTETIAALNGGLQMSWDEAQRQGFTLPTSQQEWVAAVESPRTCVRCRDIMDGQRVPLGMPFASDRGPVLGPPLHPGCRCTIALVTPIPV